jgi:cell wall-associated NlpC family hydrolase
MIDASRYTRRAYPAEGCLFLVADVLRELGRPVPELPAMDWGRDRERMARLIQDGLAAHAAPVSAGQEQEGDIATLKYRGYGCHMGVVVGGKQLIHAHPTGVAVQRYDIAPLSRRLRGFYRVE